MCPYRYLKPWGLCHGEKLVSEHGTDMLGAGGRRQGETELAGYSRNIPKPSFSSLFLGVLIDAEKSLVNKLGHLSQVI